MDLVESFTVWSDVYTTQSIEYGFSKSFVVLFYLTLFTDINIHNFTIKVPNPGIKEPKLYQ